MMRTEIATTNGSLAPRQEPLTPGDFVQLSEAMDRMFDVKQVTQSVQRPIRDELGITYRWEHDIEVIGLKPVPRGDVPQRLVDALARPSTDETVIAHLTRLALHKRHTGGASAFRAILSDLAQDLSGLSEWALVKACEDFRTTGDVWFPSTPEIIAAVRKWDRLAKDCGKREQPETETATPPAPKEKRTFRQVRRVSRLCRISAHPRENWTVWEQRFMAAYSRHARGT